MVKGFILFSSNSHQFLYYLSLIHNSFVPNYQIALPSTLLWDFHWRSVLLQVKELRQLGRLQFFLPTHQKPLPQIVLWVCSPKVWTLQSENTIEES